MNFDSNTLRSLSFGKSALGYNTEEVHSCLNEIADHVESLEKQLAEQQPKMVALAEKVAEYRGYEEGLKNVLLDAQKLAARTVSDAKAKAEAMLADAQKESDLLRSDAKRQAEAQTADIAAQIRAKEAELAELEKGIADFRAMVTDILQKQMDLLQPLPEQSEPAAPESEEIYSSSAAEEAPAAQETIRPQFTV